jgi:hypothetical protein
MSRFSDEQRAAILARGRAAIENAERTLDQPRPDFVPPVEDRVARWKREADEQAARFVRERAAAELVPTEYEASHFPRMLEQQKRLFFGVLAGVVADLRAESTEFFDEFADELQERLCEKISELVADQLGHAQLTLARQFNEARSSGGVIDLPSFLRKRA